MKLEICEHRPLRAATMDPRPFSSDEIVFVSVVGGGLLGAAAAGVVGTARGAKQLLSAPEATAIASRLRRAGSQVRAIVARVNVGFKKPQVSPRKAGGAASTTDYFASWDRVLVFYRGVTPSAVEKPVEVFRAAVLQRALEAQHQFLSHNTRYLLDDVEIAAQRGKKVLVRWDDGRGDGPVYQVRRIVATLGRRAVEVTEVPRPNPYNERHRTPSVPRFAQEPRSELAQLIFYR